VQSFPPGTILVDGTGLGARFANREFSAGPHEVEIRGPGGQVTRRTVNVPAGDVTSFCWDFEEKDICN